MKIASLTQTKCFILFPELKKKINTKESDNTHTVIPERKKTCSCVFIDMNACCTPYNQQISIRHNELSSYLTLH